MTHFPSATTATASRFNQSDDGLADHDDAMSR
jgi:hypothetical protein